MGRWLSGKVWFQIKTSEFKEQFLFVFFDNFILVEIYGEGILDDNEDVWASQQNNKGGGIISDAAFFN